MKDAKKNPIKDKAGRTTSRRKHLESAAYGAMPSPRALRALEEGPECPPELGWLWSVYCDIVRGRTTSDMGGQHLTWQDLEAWSRLRNQHLSQLEIDLILDLESVQPKEPDSND